MTTLHCKIGKYRVYLIRSRKIFFGFYLYSLLNEGMRRNNFKLLIFKDFPNVSLLVYFRLGDDQGVFSDMETFTVNGHV